MRRSVLRTAFLVAGLLSSASGAWAQTRSSITGTVTDSTGGVLPGVTVTKGLWHHYPSMPNSSQAFAVTIPGR